MIILPMLSASEYRKEQDLRISAVESRFNKLSSELAATGRFSAVEVSVLLKGLMKKNPFALRDLHIISNSINSRDLKKDAYEASYLIGCLWDDEIQRIQLPTA